MASAHDNRADARAKEHAGANLKVFDQMCVCVFITAGPITKLFAWGEGDSGGHVLRETTSRGSSCVDESAHHPRVAALAGEYMKV